MNSIIGSIPEFIANLDDWNVYEERLEQFFEINDIVDEKKSAFLISVIGSTTYKILRDLCHPILPKNKPFEELCELLRKQYCPQVAIFRERANFYNAKQLPGENVTSWYGRIKTLSVNCKFGDHLESILLDKFVTGLRSGVIIDRLCEENESITLQQAVDIAINKESAIVEGLVPQTYEEPPQPQWMGHHGHHHDHYGPRHHHHRGPGSDHGSQRGWRGKGRGGKRGPKHENWRSRDNADQNEAANE
jgi:hypothetical protein